MSFNFGAGANTPDPNKMTDLEKMEFSYNKVLDGYLGSVNKWAEYSLAVDAGEMTMEELKSKFDAHMARQGFILMLLDGMRQQKAKENADSLVEDFRKQLDSTPTAEEPKYDL